MSIFECPIPGCGRRFKEEAKLEDHVQRRHPNEAANLKDISNSYKSESAQEEKVDKATLKQKRAELLAQEKEMQETLGKLEEQEEDVKFTMNDIISSQKKLTAEYLMAKTGTDDLEDITQLILREENLYHFDDTPGLSIDDLCNLEYLALSHNKLTVTSGIGKLINLIELNINFNLVEDITPLNECLNLEKLFASNNKIRTISGIRDLTRLKCLSLTKNKLENFDETAMVLSGFPQLKELDLDRNPCTRKFTYKYDLLFHVRVEKLDGDRINPIDYDLARTFKNEREDSESLEENKSGTGNTTSGLQRPSTAPGRGRPQSNFATKLKGRIAGTEMGLMNIPENVNSEKVADLEQEIEALKERLNACEVELEETRGREQILTLENSKLTNQVNILKVEANSAYILIDQNQSLKKELQSLKVIFSNKEDIRDAKKENSLLHEQIAELLRENNELKTKLAKQDTVNNEQKETDVKERLVRKKERVLPESRNSSTSQDTKPPSSFIIRSGAPSPRASLVRTISNSSMRATPTKPIRGISEGKKPEEKPAKTIVQEGTGRKVIKVLPPRQGTPTNRSKVEVSGEDDDDIPDDEIEQLLRRSALQLTQLRSELRDFEFLEKMEAKNLTSKFEGEDVDDDDDEDEKETIDTSMRTDSRAQARKF